MSQSLPLKTPESPIICRRTPTAIRPKRGSRGAPQRVVISSPPLKPGLPTHRATLPFPVVFGFFYAVQAAAAKTAPPQTRHSAHTAPEELPRRPPPPCRRVVDAVAPSNGARYRTPGRASSNAGQPEHMAPAMRERRRSDQGSQEQLALVVARLLMPKAFRQTCGAQISRLRHGRLPPPRRAGRADALRSPAVAIPRWPSRRLLRIPTLRLLRVTVAPFDRQMAKSYSPTSTFLLRPACTDNYLVPRCQTFPADAGLFDRHRARRLATPNQCPNASTQG